MPKTFRVVLTTTTYSKKKGSVTKRYTLVRGLSSYDEAVSYVKEEYPNAVLRGDVFTNVGHSLYPNSIQIK